MILIFDTSVLVSGILFPNSALAQKIKQITQKHILLRLKETTKEFEAVLSRSKFQKFLALAVAGKADAIITGNEDLLVLHPFRGIKILTIEHFK